MATESLPRVARIDRHDLVHLPASWTNQERGRHLRLLLRARGIDPARLFRVEYHPYHRCWLVLQEGEPGRPAGPEPPPGPADERFYVQAMTLFRRAERAACAALAARSSHFACFGRPYEPPGKEQPLTPADLARLLHGAGDSGAPVRFTGEGGWNIAPSGN